MIDKEYPHLLDLMEEGIRADERAKILLKISELKSMVNVNRLTDDIIHDKPKELGMLIAYDTVIKLLEEEQK